jgi:hypothetical protein
MSQKQSLRPNSNKTLAMEAELTNSKDNRSGTNDTSGFYKQGTTNKRSLGMNEVINKSEQTI